MSSPFIGEILMFGGNFAPRNWALCDGQLINIAQNSALFSIIGTIYGGDGRTTFALPDLRGRVAMHAGNGPGLSPRRLGERGGNEQNVLNVTQLPSHSHPLENNAIEAAANSTDPSGATLAEAPLYNSGTPDVRTTPATTGLAGGNQAVNNIQPYLAVNYLIALFGVFPSRSDD